MKKWQISVSLWWDPHWRESFRRSWKQRRYWLARVPVTSAKGRVLALQFGAFTVKLMAEGGEDPEAQSERARKVRRRRR